MYKKRLILAIMLVVISIQGCSNESSLEKSNFQWVKRWLDASSCEPPCWEKITPGKTTLYDITKDTISDENNFVIKGPLPYSDGRYYITWNTMEKDITYPSVSTVTVSNSDMTIGRIEFEFGRYGSEITVKDVVSVLGEPESIGVYTEGPVESCVGVLLYPEKKIWLGLEAHKITDDYKINDDTKLSRSFFFSDVEWNNQTNIYLNRTEQIQLWKGTGEYICKGNN